LPCKTALFFPAIMTIGWLAGACFLGAWQMAQQNRIFPPVLMLCAGIVLTGFCAVLAGEFDRLYQRWEKEQALQDTLRCSECDEVLRRPYAQQNGHGICLGCVRARARADEMPQRAREAGA
jgi:hypothetical protein